LKSGEERGVGDGSLREMAEEWSLRDVGGGEEGGGEVRVEL
jgi:hypothetical protein